MARRDVPAGERTTPPAAPPVGEAEVTAVLDACRSLVAVAARSADAVADQVDLIELRILVVLAAREATALTELAEMTGLHLSRVSRGCDRLTAKALVSRAEDPADRRTRRLEVTAAGRRTVERVVAARRAEIAPALQAMSTTSRAELVRSLRAFTAASGPDGQAHASWLTWPL